MMRLQDIAACQKPLCLAIVVGLVSLAHPASADTETAESRERGKAWSFRVYLDNKVIGTHEFSLLDDGANRRLYSEAAFDVKFLFFTAFKYRHSNIEYWSGDCLARIDAHTVTNGDTKQVSGQKLDGEFVVETGNGLSKLPGCIMSFAYWNPSFLGQARLLNPQTGDFLAVDVSDPDLEQINVRGKPMDARRYRLTAKDVELQLWYSKDNEWLSLESVAKGGRIIRYELI